MVAKLSSDQLLGFLIILSILLIASRLLGEVFKKLKLPAVMGELFAGIMLGPSLLGTYFPKAFDTIFVDPKQSYSAFDGLAQVGIIFLLFVAGMEVNLENLRRRGKAAAKISIASSFFPFVTGFAATWFFYDQLFSTPSNDKLVPAMFMGTALCITALSVSAKILIDLDLIKTRFGNMILTAAMVNDFLGWMLFSIVLNMMNTQQKGFGVTQTVLIVIAFATFLMTGGRWLIDKTFLMGRRYFPSEGTNITIAIAYCILGSLFTEWVGIHAVFGAFLTGVAVGASRNFSDKSREVLHQFITNIFAPLFFASIGLRVNFVANFDWKICLFVLSIASLGKILGGTLGARLSGFKINKALAVGFGMNARGSMEIVLGLLALQAKIIDEKVFVALVIMTIITVMAAGPMINFFLRRHETVVREEATLKQRERIPATG